MRIVYVCIGIIHAAYGLKFCVIIKMNFPLEMIAIYTFRYKQIGSKIAYYRKLRDMTQETLASKANISVSALSKIERGKYNNNLSLSILFSIAKSLRIDVVTLLSFEEEEKKMQWEHDHCGRDP